MNPPPLPEFWYDYILELSILGFSEDCDCAACAMTRVGYERWKNTREFVEWEKQQEQQAQRL